MEKKLSFSEVLKKYTMVIVLVLVVIMFTANTKGVMAGILDCLCTNPTVYRNSGRYACIPWFIKRSSSGTDTGSNA